MSKKFHERLLRGSGLQARPFRSEFGAALLKKFGWEEGQGLGKDSNGRVECLQIRRREENVGLGHEDASETKAQDQWRNWWDGLYNSMAAKLKATAAQRRASQSTLSSESGDEGEGTAVKPLYGKKSFLTAGRRAQKNLSVPGDKHTTAVVERTRADNTREETDSHEEQDTDAYSAEGTNTSADQQKKPEACVSLVDGGISTAACTPCSHVSSPSCSDSTPLATLELSAVQSAVAGNVNSVPIQKKKRKKKKDGSEAVLNVAPPVDNAADGAHACACAHESNTEKKKRKRKNKNCLSTGDPETGDENAAQIRCGAINRTQCFGGGESVESYAVSEYVQLASNTGEQGGAQPFSDDLTGGGGEEARAPGDGSCEERRKIRKKLKREGETAGTKEESRGGEGGVEAEAADGDAKLTVKKKKRKSVLEGLGGANEKQRRKSKQTVTPLDV